MEEYCVYVRFRPYVFLFLEEMSKCYEIVVFTAAELSYATKIVGMFNAKKPLISHCLTREQTTFISQDEYYKDLSRLNRDLVGLCGTFHSRILRSLWITLL